MVTGLPKMEADGEHDNGAVKAYQGKWLESLGCSFFELTAEVIFPKDAMMTESDH